MRHDVWRSAACLVGAALPLAPSQASAQPRDSYAWHSAAPLSESLSARFAPPRGFEREPLAPDSFGAWLRGLPLKAGRPPVRLYDGRLKNRQDVHAAVLDIDVGRHDLQQCADAVIRLRAEWLFATGRRAAILFHATSGDALSWPRWAAGERPSVHGARIRWALRAAPDDSRASFRSYLDQVFTYAGTLSLERETVPITVDEMRIGDIFVQGGSPGHFVQGGSPGHFVQGGSPGHAVIVIDMARDAATGRRVFMLAQGYMPAQDIHVLRNPERTALDPWYPLDFGEQLVTPEWTFTRRHLRRFRD